MGSISLKIGTFSLVELKGLLFWHFVGSNYLDNQINTMLIIL